MAQLKLKHAPTVNAFNTTLNGSISDTATTIALNSVTGLQNKAGILVIDRQDADGVNTPSKREYIYFTSVSGSSVVLPDASDGRGQGGSTGQSHADGSIVEAIMDIHQYNGIVDLITVALDDDGNSLHLSTATISGQLHAGNMNITSAASGYFQTGTPLIGLNVSGEIEVGDGKQLLDYAEVTSDQGSITTVADLTNLAVTVTVPALLGRRVKITAKVLFLSNVANDVARLAIKEGGTTLMLDHIALDVTSDATTIQSIVYLTPSAASHTYKLTAERVSGSGTITMKAGATFPAFISVEIV